MIKNFGAYISAVVVIAAGLTACNSDDNSGYSTEDTGYTSETMYSSTAITSFNLKANQKVLANLDSIFFTIDLNGGRIFNADSLPYGTKITKLIPNIGTSGSSKIEILVRNSSVMNDTTITYTTSMRDSIDFSAGGIIVQVTSLNEQYTRNYTVNVNVHKVKSDSLVWDKVAWRQLPGNPVKQRTLVHNGKVMTYTVDTNGNYSLMTTDNPAGDDATTQSVTLPAGMDVRSIAATDDALFGLTDDGSLYTSADGTAWSATGERWSHIYGGYGTTLLGVKKSGNDYYHATYPDNGRHDAVSADCPISGTSDILIFDSKWNDNPQAYFTGGRIANGNFTGATWSYDGTVWAKISQTPIERPMEGITMFPYFTFRTSGKSWRVTREATLFAFGGKDETGVFPIVYISKDLGINWSKAGSLLQVPDYIPSMACADAVVWESTLGRSCSGSWNEMPLPSAPAWLMPLDEAGSRAVTEVTSWQCPYIYLYGGDNASGMLYPQVWRGVINRLTFKPLI